MTKIALLGVGFMGAPYAEHLVAEGHEVHLYNRTRSKAEAVKGAHVHDSPEQAADGADLLFSVLADDKSVLNLVTEDVLQKLKSGAVHLSCSTISVETTQELISRAERVEREHLSVPFLGRPDFVAKRAHQFLLSGRSSQRDLVLSTLKPTCKAVVDFGSDPLSAVRAKLATNFVIASAIVSMGEAFAMLEGAGIDPGKALDLWTSSLLDCPFYKNYGAKVLKKDYQDPYFLLSLGLKDTTLIQQEAEKVGAPHDIVDAVRERFAKSVEAGHGNLDWTGVTRLIREHKAQ